MFIHMYLAALLLTWLIVNAVVLQRPVLEISPRASVKDHCHIWMLCASLDEVQQSGISV